jgi:hypothetical protein
MAPNGAMERRPCPEIDGWGWQKIVKPARFFALSLLEKLKANRVFLPVLPENHIRA